MKGFKFWSTIAIWFLGYLLISASVGLKIEEAVLQIANPRLVESLRILPPFGEGLYVYTVSFVLLFFNISALAGLVIRRAVLAQFYPQKETKSISITINILIMTSPIYLVVNMTYLEIIIEIMNALL